MIHRIPEDSAHDENPARQAYVTRLEARRHSLESLRKTDRAIADARLALFVIGVLLLSIAFLTARLAWWWSAIPALGYLALLLVHDRISRRVRLAERAVAFHERGLHRLDGTWQGTGVGGERFLDPNHPYAADLDLFGAGSLFERLCAAHTKSGEETLAAWLLAPASPGVIRARNEAVDELRGQLDLREELELLAVDVQEGINPEELAAWGQSRSAFPSVLTGVISRLLAALGLAAVLAWALTDVGAAPLVLVIAADVAFTMKTRAKVKEALGPVHRRTHDLVLLSELLKRLEQASFESSLLRGLKDRLVGHDQTSSKRISRLVKLLQLLDSKDNQLFAPFAALLLWPVQLAVAIDAWRAGTGPDIPGWLSAVGEYEALSSLAAYAFENPADPFPEITDGPPLFDGEAVGHPLIPDSSCVRNDVLLGGDVQALLVSGSNMSGKSTLLRVVGVNVVLALAGAPARARRLRLSVVALGGTLRVQDSLQAGKSRFYAEITRVRQLVEIAKGPTPLLFLLDEIFHGTNSHDRVVGAGAVVRGLIGLGAIGLVTTHDLALAEIADGLAPSMKNIHFEDELVDGIMRFDYLAKPGVVRHSNALELMRVVGLDV